MTLGAKVASALAATAAAVVGILKEIPATGNEFTLLPNSLAGYLGVILSFVAVGSLINHKINNPAEKAAKGAHDEIEKQAKYFDKKITEIEAELSTWDARMRDIEKLATVAATNADHLKSAVDQLGRTVDSNHRDLRRELEKWHDEGSNYNDRILDAMVRIAGGKRDGG